MSTLEARKRANQNYLKKVRRVCIDLSPNLYTSLSDIAAAKSVTVTELIRMLAIEATEESED